MKNILYTIIIFPIEQVLELCYLFAFRISKSPGLSIIGVSIAVSTLVLPVYLMAEKHKKAEREKQKLMKEEIDNIKAVFKGDKRYMLLSTLYRQHHYHPVYALRNSIDIFIQVPFFIAAYHFLSNLGILNGQVFLFIRDLGAPDALLKGINILPVLMTIINFISGAIYTKGLPYKDKIQLYGLATVFLVLLYNSPSALVLYWTGNNLYSLIKNVILKNRYAKELVDGLLLLVAGTLSCYLLFIHKGSFEKRVFIVALIVAVLLAPVWKRILFALQNKVEIKNTVLDLPLKTFMLSLVGLFLLIGLVIPSGLIVSDVEEFSFLKPFSSPLPYLGITLLQSIGFFLWFVCIYLLFDKRVRILLTFVLTISCGLFILNTFVFTGDYGHLLPDMHFFSFSNTSVSLKVINIVGMLIIGLLMTKLLIWKKKRILLSLQSIMVLVFLCFGIINVVKIRNEYKKLNKPSSDVVNLDKIYTFSRTGKNVVIVVLDRFIAGYVPYIFEEKPELLKSFTGFTLYPNTISFGGYTNHGMPGIWGGYYYTPLEIQKRTDELWQDNYYESYQVLPRIMAEDGYKVTVYNQPANANKLYSISTNINVGRNEGRYRDYYLNSFNNSIVLKDYYKIFYNNLIRFSFFRVSPLVLHEVIYDDGNYLLMDNSTLLDSTVGEQVDYSNQTVNSYTSLYYLPDITDITDDNDNYSTMFISMLPHSPAFLKPPEYTLYNPSELMTDKGKGRFSNTEDYHVDMASFLLLAKWLEFLRDNGVYSNTRIIIVSDHGRSFNPIHRPYNITLPKYDLVYYAALLMVKDFYEEFELQINNDFMTNADVPHIATERIIQDLCNPFNGKKLLAEKENGAILTTLSWADNQEMLRNLGDIKMNKDQWLHVHTNIFDPVNWSEIIIDGYK